jgi:molybdate transport system ATP-binding protein
VSLETAASWLGISEQLERSPSTLSGGERQRVAVARALVSSPVLMLMDEPIAALDAAARSAVLGHLEHMRRGLEIPMLYVTHAVDEVARLGDRVVWLDQGKVRGTGTPGEVLGRLDVGMSLGDEAGGFVDAVVRQHDPAYHLTELECAWGRIVISQVAAEPGEVLTLRVRASDVSIGLERERSSSILNVFEGLVQALAEDSPGQVLVRLVCPTDDSLALLARVTRRSVEHLELAPGLSVYLRVKGVSVR